MSDEMSPEMDGGVPLCAGDDCPQYDGKRCRLTGFRPDPGQSCEPAVREIVDERDRLRARVSELEAVRWWWCPEHGSVLGAEVHKENGGLRHRGSEDVGDCGCDVTPDEEAWQTARREGAKSIRERAAAKLKQISDDIVTQSEEFRARGNAKVADRLLAEARAVAATSAAIRALPLDDDAREGAQEETHE